MSDLKPLPFCAVCGISKKAHIHFPNASVKLPNGDVTGGGYKDGHHEFKPVYNAEDVEEKIDELEIRLDNALEGKSEACLVRD